MVDINDARTVIEEVLARYTHVLPDGVEKKVRALGAAKIYFILKQANYAPNFGAYFRSWFAATNINSCVGLEEIVVCGNPQKLIQKVATSPVTPDELAAQRGKLKPADPLVAPKGEKGWKPPLTTGGATKPDVYTQFACPAFCIPAVKVEDRKIFVNENAGVTIGTLYHEFIHFLSHGNFYPEFYATAGRSAIIVEGVTEYLTREISPAVERDRSSQGKYDRQLGDVIGKMPNGKSTKTLTELQKLLFQGDLTLIPTLGGVKPRTATV